MKKIISLIFLSSLLSGCFIVHKMNIEQGNVFNQAEVSRLHPGMSREQVKEIMGNPVMVNIFSNNREDYVYTNQPGHENITIKRVTCVFEGGRLAEIIRR
jgi:outer membrane protein assembly factor BamE